MAGEPTIEDGRFPRSTSLRSLGTGVSFHWHGISVKLPFDQYDEEDERPQFSANRMSVPPGVASGYDETLTETTGTGTGTADIEQGLRRSMNPSDSILRTPPRSQSPVMNRYRDSAAASNLMNTANIQLQQQQQQLQHQQQQQQQQPYPSSSTSNVTRRRMKPKPKTLLSNITGYVEPGQLLFILGSSDGNKEILLKSLCDQLGSDYLVSGHEYVNYERRVFNDRKAVCNQRFRAVSKYLSFQNIGEKLFPKLTVKETLDLSAGVYIAEDANVRSSVVLDVMDIMGLTANAHTRADALTNVHKYRLLIGCELLSTPQLLFLNNPAHNLGDIHAFHLMSDLKRVVRATSMSIVVTLNEPSELVFELADNMLLLSGGKTAYFGSVNHMATYLHALGFDRPQRMAEIEWAMHLVDRDFSQHDTVDKCIRRWPKSAEAAQLDRYLEDAGVLQGRSHTISSARPPAPDNFTAEEAPQRKDEDDAEKPKRYNVSIVQQIRVLLTRGALTSMRNATYVWLRFLLYIIASIVIGLVWLRIEARSDPSVPNYNVADMNIALLAVTSFSTALSLLSVPLYLHERRIVLYQQKNEPYSISAYCAAHTLLDASYLAVIAVISSLITYFMVGLTLTVDRIAVYFANLFVSVLAAQSIVTFVAMLAPSLLPAATVSGMVFAVLTTFQAAFLNVNHDVGWWVRWLKFVSPHFYTFSTFVVNEYHGQTFADGTLGNSIYSAMRVESRMWINFVVLISMSMLFRLLTVASLKSIAKRKN